MGGGQNRRLQPSGRRHHGYARHARHPGWNRIHQHGRRIGGATARNIEADRIQRRPAPAELHPRLVDEMGVLGSLAFVIGADPAGREGDGLAHRERGFIVALQNLGLGHPQRRFGQVRAVELARAFQQALKAARAHLVDDGDHGGLDIGAAAARLGQIGFEFRSEFGVGVSEYAGQIALLNPRCATAHRWRPRARQDRLGRRPGIRPQVAGRRRPRKSG